MATYTDRPVNNFNTADIRARLFGADGLPGNFLEIAVDPGATFGSDVAALADGGFAVTWTRLQALDFDVLMSVHNADGSVRHAADAVNVNLAHNAFGTVAGLAGGGFVVAWEQSNEVRYRRFDANGNALDGTDAIGTLIDASGGIKTDVRVAGLPDGGFVVAYQDGNWGTSWGSRRSSSTRMARSEARCSMSTPSGTAAPPNARREPTVTVLPNGYFVVGWIDGHAAQHLQAYDALGNALGRNAVVATQVQTGEIEALHEGLIADVWGCAGTGGALAALPDGGFVVTYTNGGVLYGRVYQANGTARTGNIVIDAAGDNSRSKVAGLPNGNWAVAYRDTGWLDADARQCRHHDGHLQAERRPGHSRSHPCQHAGRDGRIRSGHHGAFGTASSSSPGRIRFR